MSEKKVLSKFMIFVLGHILSHPGPVAQVGHPWLRDFLKIKKTHRTKCRQVLQGQVLYRYLVLVSLFKYLFIFILTTANSYAKHFMSVFYLTLKTHGVVLL